MSGVQRIAKFRDCAAHAQRALDSAAVDRLIATLASLETVPDGKALAALLA